jgi:hypothetical protein
MGSVLNYRDHKLIMITMSLNSFYHFHVGDLPNYGKSSQVLNNDMASKYSSNILERKRAKKAYKFQLPM